MAPESHYNRPRSARSRKALKANRVLLTPDQLNNLATSFGQARDMAAQLVVLRQGYFHPALVKSAMDTLQPLVSTGTAKNAYRVFPVLKWLINKYPDLSSHPVIDDIYASFLQDLPDMATPAPIQENRLGFICTNGTTLQSIITLMRTGRISDTHLAMAIQAPVCRRIFALQPLSVAPLEPKLIEELFRSSRPGPETMAVLTALHPFAVLSLAPDRLWRLVPPYNKELLDTLLAVDRLAVSTERTFLRYITYAHDQPWFLQVWPILLQKVLPYLGSSMPRIAASLAPALRHQLFSPTTSSVLLASKLSAQDRRMIMDLVRLHDPARVAPQPRVPSSRTR